MKYIVTKVYQYLMQQLQTYDVAAKSKDAFLYIYRKSESPMGFLAIAVFGISLVILTQSGESNTGEHKQALNSRTQEAPSPTVAANETRAEPTSQEAMDTPETERLILRKGETLIKLLMRAGIHSRNAHTAIDSLRKVTNLRKLRAGQTVELVRLTDNPDSIQELRIRDTFHEKAITRKTDTGYSHERQPIKTIQLTHLVEGTISDSLYMSGKKAGLPDKVIVELIRLLSFDVDFEREIRSGDHFEVYFGRSYAPEFNEVEDGKILHTKLTMRKREIDAYFYKDKNGDEGYYDADGKSTRRSLMKTPLDVVYVTDSYGPRKKHPVLGYRTMHQGTDFRARPGTPVMASGDGVIEMAARNGSYGKYIRIRHNGSYKTAYAHLSRYGKGIKKGSRVKQGQIIGYSGATGRVNGPHLHYEVHYNNKPVNPMTLELPSGKTLTADELKNFRLSQSHMTADMDLIRNVHTVLANNKADTSDRPVASIADAR